MKQVSTPPAGERPTPLVQVAGLNQWFRTGRTLLRKAQVVHAVEDVSLSIERGEVLGLVGESGSGKSTLGRAILRMTEPTNGQILFDGMDLTHLGRRALRPMRPRMQLVFQDPFSSLNPRMTLRQIVGAPLVIQRPDIDAKERERRILEALRTVGLSPQHADRYPHEFSGGQRQRVGIARALIMEPSLLVADEPVSALDVSIQAQIVNLLIEVRKKLDLTMLFISHDLAVVGHLCDRVAVMYLGRIVEIAPTRTLYRSPRHPYTEALFSAVPGVDPDVRRERIILRGDVPSPLAPPSGCAFRGRCRYALPECATAVPPLREIGHNHSVRCVRDDLVLSRGG
ncbi:ABC transporter ATP-binding protein [Rhizobium sp. NPDC090275]|uniref:ABC transporter ATP-binding protein n=1 Tax=Rhizobium sp. NPDC090275 TaxID=3364498 RepID=UPI00383BDBC2